MTGSDDCIYNCSYHGSFEFIMYEHGVHMSYQQSETEESLRQLEYQEIGHSLD